MTFDSVDNIAESVLLGQPIWNLFQFEGAWPKRNLIREASVVNNLSLALTSEEGLHLVENVAQFELWLIQEGELPCVGLAPEESALWEVLVSLGVLSNGDVIIGFNSYS